MSSLKEENYIVISAFVVKLVYKTYVDTANSSGKKESKPHLSIIIELTLALKSLCKGLSDAQGS